jgi:hypothetical protein
VLSETYYYRFNNELERQRISDIKSKSPYYIEHIHYERDGADGNTDFMLVVTYGNFFSQDTLVRGRRIPVPVYGADDTSSELEADLCD